MLVLKNFSSDPRVQKSELLEILEAEQALGWTTVSDLLSEQDEALRDLVNVIYEGLMEYGNE